MSIESMSKAEAVAVLFDMAAKGGGRREVEAIQLAVRSLVKRRFDQLKARAGRRDRESAHVVKEGGKA